MSGGLDPHYDFALLGTSLPISILSAALSRAGFSVLHIDEEEHYGGPWASLTLTELFEWSRNTALHQSQGRNGVTMSFPAFHQPQPENTLGEIPQELMSLNRHFAISLVPTIVPCAGPTIDILIRSKVASYCTFRLLQKTTIFDEEEGKIDKWPLRKIPASKEDIFKDKDLSLVDKRKLMKLLQNTARVSLNAEVATKSLLDEEILKLPFLQYLTSKEGPNLSSQLATNIAYGVALCSSDQDSTALAMERIRRHITSIGQYGNAAYLVGQYGGAGEMAQCFCRASAVQGGTFVLGHRIKQCSLSLDGATKEVKKWDIALEALEGATKVDRVIADEDVRRRIKFRDANLDRLGSVVSVTGIMLLDRGIAFEQIPDTVASSPETGLVVFPPQADGEVGAVTALQMAEGTFSCPKGMYLIHLSATVKKGMAKAADARKILSSSRNCILKLARRNKAEWKQEAVMTETDVGEQDLLPLMECYYSQCELGEKDDDDNNKSLLSVSIQASSLATSLDEATLQAEQLFWQIIGNEKRAIAEEARRKRKPIGYTVGRGLGGVVLEDSMKEVMYDFFPLEEDGANEEDE